MWTERRNNNKLRFFLSEAHILKQRAAAQIKYICWATDCQTSEPEIQIGWPNIILSSIIFGVTLENGLTNTPDKPMVAQCKANIQHILVGFLQCWYTICKGIFVLNFEPILVNQTE